jgi:RNA polymerase sigma-70 factor (ECF subfamily)
LKEGNGHARALFYEEYRKNLYAFCYRMILNKQAAEDLTHEVFLKVLVHIASLRENSAFRSWVFGIARNEVFGYLRRERTGEPLEKNELWDSQSPLDVLLEKEETRVVQKLLLRLSPAYREVLVLREYHGLSYTEIAAATMSTELAVKARLFKARKAMLELARPYFGKE